MPNAFLYMMAAHAVELIIFLSAMVVVVTIVLEIDKIMRSRACKHERYRETSKCDAICVECGENLGFIQPLRDRDRLREQEKEQQP